MPAQSCGVTPVRAALLLVGAACATAGCSRTPPIEYVSSKEVDALPPEVQSRIASLLEETCGTAQGPKLLGAANVSAEHLQHGRDVYMQRCSQCHGATGDGNGPSARWMYPRPRDYRRGKFKFTSTPYDARPQREDLLRTVRVGVPGTSMPSFALLPEKDLDAVADYVLSLTRRGELEFQLAYEAESSPELDADTVEGLIKDILDSWNRAEAEAVHPVTPEPTFTAEMVAEGKKAFLSKGCSKCHGDDGRGQTPENLRGDLKDSWSHPTRAADLTSGMLHGGREPVDIYRRIFSGISGTPMPGHKAALAEEPQTIWNLVAYVLYVSNRRRAGDIPEAGNLGPYISPTLAAEQ